MVSTSTSTSSSASIEEEDRDTFTSKGLIKRDRYIATNRFAVRNGKEAKFEARWANRKSRLASLQGFRYFHLMRRVVIDNETSTYDNGKNNNDMSGNYVSFTIWDKKSDFSRWRKGDAFKEAHGGTSLTAFISTMIGSAFVLKGAPRPAFYDGILTQNVIPDPDSVPETVDGWRNVDADGMNVLPAECFVASNQFFVDPDNMAAFEERWSSRKSALKDCHGFVAFSMMRRDGSAKGHGVKAVDTDTEPTYLSTTIWKDRASFEAWRNGSSSSKHSTTENKDPNKNNDNNNKGRPLWNKPPVPVFYEGTLVISSNQGA
eukprot:CAMPEP_0184858204 /NCGR_PEP_ID=MMETSP0580-20130426/3328_1 /TAXON_ID=1118495 /ORGANISM="Dactyliosolen fragilissimus" /LENGTH=316 /DNA_ID=CAMNT_0027354229 /DNA_START=155 /DNA_END=1105 /DNA_ORIENTATION=+